MRKKNCFSPKEHEDICPFLSIRSQAEMKSEDEMKGWK